MELKVFRLFIEKYRRQITSIFLVLIILGVIPGSMSYSNISLDNKAFITTSSLGNDLNQLNELYKNNNGNSGGLNVSKPHKKLYKKKTSSRRVEQKSVNNVDEVYEFLRLNNEYLSSLNSTKGNDTNKSVDDLAVAASNVVGEIELTHRLPENVRVGNKTLSVSEYLDQITQKTINIYNNNATAPLINHNVTAPNNSSDNCNLSIISPTNYVQIANDVQTYIKDHNNTAPGNISVYGFDNLVYIFSQILNSYNAATFTHQNEVSNSSQYLPNSITVYPWSKVSDNSTAFISPVDMYAAINALQSHVESKHKLPDSLTIAKCEVNMSTFLYLLTVTLLNLEGNLYQSVIYINFENIIGTTETIADEKLISKNFYLSNARTLLQYFKGHKNAPRTIRFFYTPDMYDNVRFESLVYFYSQVIISTLHNRQLPSMVYYTRWDILNNINSVFVGMDEICTGAEWVKNYVETNHNIPNNVVINGRQISLPNFLNLLVTSIINAHNGCYASVFVGDHGNPIGAFTDNFMPQPWSIEGYYTRVLEVKENMKNNGRAPDHITVPQEKGCCSMRFENAIYTFSYVLCCYNKEKSLASEVEIYLWNHITNPSTFFYNVDQITVAAIEYVSYVENNHDEPPNVTIAGRTVSYNDFFKLESAALNRVLGTTTGPIIQIAINKLETTGAIESIRSGSLNQSEYTDYIESIDFYTATGQKLVLPCSLGDMSISTCFYMMSQILRSYNKTHVLPEFINLHPWNVIKSPNTKFYTIIEVITASKTVQEYIETNHALPSNVTVNGCILDTKQFLYLLTSALLNINGVLSASLVCRNYGTAGEDDSIHAGNMNSTTYLKIARDVKDNFDRSGNAPGWAGGTGLGDHMGFSNLVYTYTKILNSYNATNGTLPDLITANPWKDIINPNTGFYTLDQVINASKTVQEYIETNHALPVNVPVNGTPVSKTQFLYLTTTSLIYVSNRLKTTITLKDYNNTINPVDDIISGIMDWETYLKIAENVKKCFDEKDHAPDYANETGLGSHMGFNSLLYVYSQVLNSYNLTNSSLADFIIVHPWSKISDNCTVFVTMNQVKDAADSTKKWIETNHSIPYYADIGNNRVTMAQFLKLLVESVINYEGYLCVSLLLNDVTFPTDITENITSGYVPSGELTDIAKNVQSYIVSNGKAPGNIQNTSLGDSIGYYSMIYMFSRLMSTYNATEIPPDEALAVPWLALSTPYGIFNFRTQKTYYSIEDAINDENTIAGDEIWLLGNYSANTVINKKIILKPLNGFKASVMALNPDLPVFRINMPGNGTLIRDLNISSSCFSSTYGTGIYIDNSCDNNILGNTITGKYGIYLCFNSTGNIISGNNITNAYYGIYLDTGSTNNTISVNTLVKGYSGIESHNSCDNGIYGNFILYNTYGVKLIDSSNKVQYNSISGNQYGLYNTGNGIVNATNNWWGTNNDLRISHQNGIPCDICILGGVVACDPWLVLTLNSSTDRSECNCIAYTYIITVDFVHNNKGEDTSGGNQHVPDGIPVQFQTTLGTIPVLGTTRNGKIVLKLSNSTEGVAVISATVNQTISGMEPLVTPTIQGTVNIVNINVWGVTNTRTNKYYKSIQEAVDDVETVNGDVITIAEGTYTENVRINKRLTIKPETNANVVVKSRDDDKSVFVIGSEGSGTIIQGLTIVSSSSSYALALSHSYNNQFINNTITNSSSAIYLYYSGNNIINGNHIKNAAYGVYLVNSNNNIIQDNMVSECEAGVYVHESDFNLFKGNELVDNYYSAFIYDSNNVNFVNNIFKGNWVGVYLFITNNNNVSENNFTDNGVAIAYYNSVIASITVSSNVFSDNWITDTSIVDDGNMVMATTMYTCGPAALATLLKNLGLFSTESEIAKLAKTDNTGTSLLGLAYAANVKGYNNAWGVRLTIDQLQKGYLVVLNIDGYKHFEVIQNITDTTIYLFDPNLGLIEMNLTKFESLYTGDVFVLNKTLFNSSLWLTEQEMKNIKALSWHWEKRAKTKFIPGFWLQVGYKNERYVYKWIGKYEMVWINTPRPSWYPSWLPWGHFEYLQTGWRPWYSYRKVPVYRYIPPRTIAYETYEKVTDSPKNYKFNWNKLDVRHVASLAGLARAAYGIGKRIMVRGAMVGVGAGLAQFTGVGGVVLDIGLLCWGIHDFVMEGDPWWIEC